MSGIDMEDEDAGFMVRFKEGDDSAFEKLFAKYKKPLLNTVYRFIGNRSEAEDIIQDVFLKVYQARNSYKPTAKFSTWLYRIVRNSCFNWYRHHRTIRFLSLDKPLRSPDNEFLREIAAPSKNDPDVLLKEKELKKQVQSALQSLPEKQKMAIILRGYEKKTYEEIAGIMDCSVSAVKSLIFRARINLRIKIGLNLTSA